MSLRRTRRTPLGLPWICIALGGMAGPAPAQEPEPDNPVDTAPPSMADNIRRLIQTMSQIPSWEAERENILNAAAKVFDANGWNSEPDQFAFSLMEELEQLPPTAFQQRFDTLVGALSDRYMLSEEQEQIMRRTIRRESHDLFMKHSGRIMQYGLEALQTRIGGEPFTPEQVARWVELAEPVFLDARQRVAAAAERFMGDLDPEQQALLRRDMEADERRANRMLEMAQGWKRGEWKPEDWGLDEDPIQTSGGPAARAEGAPGAPPDGAPPGSEAPPATPEDPGAAPPSGAPPEGGMEPPPPGAAPPPPTREPQPPPARVAADADNDPWALYVRNFVSRYGLNDNQQQRAWSIYREVRTHRDQLTRRAAARDGAAARPAMAAEDPVSAVTAGLDDKQRAAVERLFEQLKRRLERLPTRAQRKAAAATPTAPGREQPAKRP